MFIHPECHFVHAGAGANNESLTNISNDGRISQIIEHGGAAAQETEIHGRWTSLSAPALIVGPPELRIHYLFTSAHSDFPSLKVLGLSLTPRKTRFCCQWIKSPICANLAAGCAFTELSYPKQTKSWVFFPRERCGIFCLNIQNFEQNSFIKANTNL